MSAHPLPSHLDYKSGSPLRRDNKFFFQSGRTFIDEQANIYFPNGELFRRASSNDFFYPRGENWGSPPGRWLQWLDEIYYPAGEKKHIRNGGNYYYRPSTYPAMKSSSNQFWHVNGKQAYSGYGTTIYDHEGKEVSQTRLSSRIESDEELYGEIRIDVYKDAGKVFHRYQGDFGGLFRPSYVTLEPFTKAQQSFRDSRFTVKTGRRGELVNISLKNNQIHTQLIKDDQHEPEPPSNDHPGAIRVTGTNGEAFVDLFPMDPHRAREIVKQIQRALNLE